MALGGAVVHPPGGLNGWVRTATLRAGPGRTPLGRWLVCCLLGSLLGGWGGDAWGGSSLSADIPAGPLSVTLAEFARQTGLQLVYVSDVAKDRTSHMVRAGTLPARALTELLAGTGLGYTFVNDRTVRIYVLEAAPEAPQKLAAEQAAILPSLEEVVVLASRGGEQVRDVPISLVVWSSDAMDMAGAKSLDQVAALTPSMEYDFDTAVGAGISTNLSIRGVNDAGGRSTTRIFVDDAPLHSLQSDFGEIRPLLFDVDRVEVIRGPQGALLGEGTEGGAVRLLLRQPSLTEFSGTAHVEAATTENGGPSYEAGAAAGGPIVRDLIGFRLSGWYRRDGGYVDHVDPLSGALVEASSNYSESKSGRVALSVAPADGVLITPSLSYQSVDLHDSPIFYQDLSNLDAGALRNGKLLRQPYDDSYTLASLNLSADLSFAHLTAVASYLHRSADTLVDYTNSYPNYFLGEFGPLPRYPVAYENAAGFTHELAVNAGTGEVRLRSPNPEARLTWMVGAFYSNVRQDDLQTLTNNAVYCPPASDGSSPQCFGQTDEQFKVGATIDSRIRATQIAGFGEADVRISSRLRASVGVRATVDESQQAKAYAGVTAPVPATQRDNPVAPRADLSYQADPGRLLYAAVAKGYRSAGIDAPSPFPCTTDVSVPFPADSVWSAELGTKNTLAGGRVHLELSAYYMRWENLHQLLFSRTNCTQVASEDDATSRGFDLALQAFATTHLRTELGVSYIDAHYSNTSYLSGAGANDHDYFVISRGDWLGTLPQVPSPWTATASIAYEIVLPRSVTANLQVQDIFHSHNPGTFFTRPTGEGCCLQPQPPPHPPPPWAWSVTEYPWADPATNVVNLRARFSGSNTDLSFYVNNALNSHPLLLGKTEGSTYGVVFGPPLVYGTTFRPRTVGVVLGMRF
jgi:iron complex outermembrane recepter protein